MSMSPSSATDRPAAPPDTRAVLRSVEAGSFAECVRCGERVKFQAKLRNQQVICNVYVDGRWNRVEHFHASCYQEAGHPYGQAAA